MYQNPCVDLEEGEANADCCNDFPEDARVLYGIGFLIQFLELLLEFICELPVYGFCIIRRIRPIFL